MRCAHDLVPVALSVQRKYGIPIVNRRVAVTPISQIMGSDDPADFVQVAHALDRAAAAVGIDFVGGFSAMVQKGFTRGDDALIQAIPEAIAGTQARLSVTSTAANSSRFLAIITGSPRLKPPTTVRMTPWTISLLTSEGG